MWDAAVPPSVKPGGETAQAQAWSEKIAAYDGYVFVVSEYNHSITGALKNALDYLEPELENRVDQGRACRRVRG